VLTRQGERFAGKTPEWVFQTGPKDGIIMGGILTNNTTYYENEGFTLKLPHYTGQSPAPLTADTPLRHTVRAVRNPFPFTVASSGS